MKKVEYSDEAIIGARELEARLNSYFGKMGVLGTKCSSLATKSVLNTGLMDIDHCPYDGVITQMFKAPVRAFVNSCRKDALSEMLDVKKQAEVLFVDHCGVFSEAKKLLAS